jgi:nucleoid DNA-binding protein
MDKKFIKAFREVVREEIVKKNTVEIDGLGRFEIVHNKQHQKKMDDGQVLMMPPQDVVEFTPEKTGKNED